MSVVYDTAVLVGADRSDRDVWADHRLRLEMGAVPATTAPVVAQVSRSPWQVQLRRFLRGCEIIPFSPEQGHEVGMLLGQAGTSDVVDAHVAVVAAPTHSTILTSDLKDFRQLSNHLSAAPPLRRA
jgi:predicted nucleic acid-binding protein